MLDTVKDISRLNTDHIKDEGFKKFLNKKLSLIGGKIIIVRNNNVVFSSENIDKINIENSIEQSHDKFSRSPIIIGSTYYSVESFPIEFNNKSQVNVIFLTPIRRETDPF